ncbi:MAG: DpnI domain-containing protein [Candidatus Didemnitutus sp.]|nr:DpnI domain-containing protein [Candidatus Didemnitutus sp.]
MPAHLGARYKSPSQQARCVSESWGTENLYCCACVADKLLPESTNTSVTDFRCPSCVGRYQLKSQSRKLGRSILGSNYQKMLAAVLGNRSPNFFLLHYQLPEWFVRNLVVIPRFAISPTVIQKRAPLAASARRAQWIGYKLDLGLVPAAAKISLLVEGSEVSPTTVRAQFARISRIQELKPAQRGWTLDVLRCVETLPHATFANDEVYAFEAELSLLYPGNRHIKDKLRQQLQVLRDRGFLTQPSRGVWHRT